VIIVTHDPEEAALLADELLVLEGGRVLQTGPVQVVFSRPANELVARLLGAENVSEGLAVAENQIAIEGGATLIVAGPALQPGTRVGWSVRPERVRLSADGRYEAKIESVAMIGSACEVSVRLGHTLLRVLTDPSVLSLTVSSDFGGLRERCVRAPLWQGFGLPIWST
jgi:molybdate transport system permease protein